jgi:hypothetical protein
VDVGIAARITSVLLTTPTRHFNVAILMASPNQGAPEQQPVLSKVEARQGVTGHNVRYVLWFGLAAVVVAFAAIYLFYFD